MQRSMMTIARCVVVLFCACSLSYAQSTVLLRGTILGNHSGSKVELTFRDEAGSAVRASSASDGTYQTVVKSGHTYTVVITDDNFKRFTFSFTVPAATKYTELTHDFKLEEPLVAAAAPPATKTKKKTKAKKSTKGK